MKKQRSKPTKPRNSHASFSRTELAAKLGVDVRTIDRRCGVLGVKPSKRLPGKAVTYRLTPEQLDQLQHRLDSRSAIAATVRPEAGEVAGGNRTPPPQKPQTPGSESTPNWFLAKLLKAMADRIPSIVENRLETLCGPGRGPGTGGTSLPGQVHQRHDPG
jgi:hypothetical protein